mmetsp:Transcript_27007/g.51078  ORF Transcript_27007/g.51078 Transcript_27007/m.51078 type:complete len:87 (-) Transcript_27007:155-415(-)
MCPKLQLVVTTTLWLSSKHKETREIAIGDFTHIYDETYAKRERSSRLEGSHPRNACSTRYRSRHLQRSRLSNTTPARARPPTPTQR